ncbi:MAG TPA: M28 family peptidase [Planctomycetaceae bacterium]|nr:M28 family peptidase [Planctomycetaceae bacterium]
MTDVTMRQARPASRRRTLWLVVVCTVCGIAGGSAADPPRPSVCVPRVSEAAIRCHVEYLAGPELGGRRGPGGQKAAQYVRDHFADLQLRPLFGTSYFQPIHGLDPNGSRQTVVIGRNVGAWLSGCDRRLKDEAILIAAHYDHLGTIDGRVYPGADDNASGVAMLLEVARVLSKSQGALRRSVLFVSFDLEEQMLLGSRWFVAHSPVPLKRIRLAIVADLLGRSLGDLPVSMVFVCGAEHSRRLRTWLRQVQPAGELELARLAADMIGTRSDYGPFRDRHVPFLFFSTGEHADYHTPNDVAERVRCAQVARIADVIVQLIQRAANADEPPEWENGSSVVLDEAKVLSRVTGLLLDPHGHYPLNALQRALVERIHRQAERVAAQKRCSSADRVWLRRSIQLLLVSVF